MLDKFFNSFSFDSFSFFLNDKTKEDATPNFTKGVRSIICFPIQPGFSFDLNSILSGKEDDYWSNIEDKLDIEYKKKALFFNDYNELKAYLSSDEWRKSWRSKVHVGVFFLGCSQPEAHVFFEQGKFSELVIRASRLDDLFVPTIRVKEVPNPSIIENERFNAYLLSSSAQKPFT